jgi:hypothetical protein
MTVRNIRHDERLLNQDGTPTREFLDLWNALTVTLGGQGGDTVGGIVAGTQTLSGVTVDGVGDLATVLDTQAANTTAAAQSGGGSLTVVASVPALFKVGSGALTTNPVTITASGGTAPYTNYDWTWFSGDPAINFTINTPTADNTTFTATPGSGNTLSATFCGQVTDTAVDAAAVYVSVYFEGDEGI